MPLHRSIATLALAAALSAVTFATQAADDSKYPDWRGQWRRPQGVGIQWDPSKPLTWDAKNLRATNEPEAERFLRKEYRKPWTL